MIYFIIYEDFQEFRKKYTSVILKLMEKTQSEYKIIEYSEYNQEMKKIIKNDVKKIYILDIEVPKKSGIDVVREIRDSGDWNSQIIMVTSHDNLQMSVYSSRLLILSFLSKFDNIQNTLLKSLFQAYTILTSDKCLKLEKNSEFNKFYYNEIVYIQKENNSNDVIIKLSDGTQEKVNSTIGLIDEKLNSDPRFVRTHRSCIVNISKIKKVDFNTNTMYFGICETDMISRENKKKLKEALYEICDDFEEIK